MEGGGVFIHRINHFFGKPKEEAGAGSEV